MGDWYRTFAFSWVFGADFPWNLDISDFSLSSIYLLNLGIVA